MGARIKGLRKEKGLTQLELAEPAYTHAYVSTVEAGKRNPSQGALEHFASKLGIGVEELLTGRPPGMEGDLRLRLAEARIKLSRGQIDEARGEYSDIRRVAEGSDLPLVAAGAVEGLARCLEQEGKLEDAAEMFEAVEGVLEHQPEVASAGARCGRARCVAQRGDRRFAVYLLESFLDRIKTTPSPDALVYVHATLIPIYFQLGAFAAAKESADEALRLAARVTDPFALATMHLQVARVLLARGHTEIAQESLVEAGKLFLRQELETETGMAHLARGYVVARSKGAHREARLELDSAREIFKRTGRRTDEGRAANELGRLLRKTGKITEAREMFSEAMTLISRESDASELALSHREFGLTFMDDEPERAEKELRTAIDLFDLAEDTLEGAVTHRYLGLALRASGRKAAACETFERGLSLLERSS